MTIGEQIKIIRKSRGMTQYELADASYLSSSYISRIENGKATPSSASLRDIAVALDFDVKTLICIEYEESSKTSIPEQIRQEAEHLSAEAQEDLLQFLKTLNNAKLTP